MTDATGRVARMTVPNQATRRMSEIAEAGDPAEWRLRREMIDFPLIAHLSIDGEPVSKARARFTSYGSPRQVYTPDKTRTAEDTIMWHFRRARPDWGQPDATQSYGVFAMFFCGTRQRRDVDNMLKLVLDACNKLVWQDDAQVYEVSGRRLYTPGDVRSEIAIYSTGDTDDLTKPCERCGAPIKIFTSTAKRRFCSRECAYDQRRDKVCPGCGKVFNTTAKVDQKHCSRECADAARNVVVTCLGCGKRFTKVQSWVRTSNFCTSECHSEHWRRRRATTPKGNCRVCGAPVSRKEYKRCNACRIAGKPVPEA